MAKDSKNNFALVQRPSSAVEKVAPGAKRILSGMVTDTLSLAKKPDFTVFMCDDQISGAAEAMIRHDWNQKYALRFIRFKRATELLKLTREQPFDLIFMYVGNVEWDVETGHRFGAAVKFLGQLKADHGKPIIVTQGMDLMKEFEGTGVIFIHAPFSIEELRSVLEANLPAQIKPKFSIALCGHNDEWIFELLDVVFQGALAHKFSIKLARPFFADELIEAASQNTFDLFLIFLNPNLPRKHGQPNVLDQSETLDLIIQLKSKFQKPIFIISNETSYSRILSPLFMKAGANAFLGMPFSIDEIYEAMTSSGMNPIGREK